MISILCATRGRPEAYKRMCQSALDLADGEIEFVSYHDDDDTTEYDYIGSHKEIVGPRIMLSQTWNECQKAASGPFYMYLCDDFVFKTRGWDTQIKKEFNKFKDKIVLVYCDDGIQGKRMGTVGVLHKNWVDVVGYLFPPYFSGNYPDKWVTDVARRVGRKVYTPVLVEHMHYRVGKGEIDKTMREKMDRDKRDNNRQIYKDKENERVTDAIKLRKAIHEF